MHKLKTILFQYNRSFMPVNMSISLALLYILAGFPFSITNILNAVLFKIVIYAGIIGYQWYAANRSWYYYRNAGYSVRQIFTYSCVVDMLIFLIVCALIYI